MKTEQANGLTVPTDLFFDKFNNKVELRASLVCKTALRIGAGRGGLDTLTSSLPILRTSHGIPVIPGASLKGVLRSLLESVLRTIAPDDSVQKLVCDPFVAPCYNDETPSSDTTLSLLERAQNRRIRIQSGVCDMCRTFGAPGLSSHIFFSDALPEPEAEPRVERRDGVSIDRDLGRVSGNRKFDFEVVSPGTRFALQIVMDGTEAWQQGLVVYGLELLSKGYSRLGGMGSRGLGLVEIQPPKVSILSIEHLKRGEFGEDRSWESYSTEVLGAFRANLKDKLPESKEGVQC